MNDDLGSVNVSEQLNLWSFAMHCIRFVQFNLVKMILILRMVRILGGKMSVKLMVGLATAGSVFVIIMSLVAVCIIYNDINSLYDDVMDEMGEFRVCNLFL